jgi:Ca2+-binding RTX toxin-like protein
LLFRPPLNAGAGNDTIQLQALPAGSLTVHGQGGINTLDYSAFSTGVYVNLATHEATGLAAFDGIQNVTGGAGNDLLVGDAANNVLIGGGGRNLLIGGAGEDQLMGGSGDDLLIAGTTAFDQNKAALLAIMAEWDRPDADYPTRIAHLTGTAGGLNQGFYLNSGSNPNLPVTVFNDADSDTLTGGAGLNWFFYSPYQDQITDWQAGERLN